LVPRKEFAGDVQAGHGRAPVAWDWPGRNMGDLADSAMAFTLAQGHQRTQTTAERANGGAGLLQRAIARAIERG
jgi:hypothetical protein